MEPWTSIATTVGDLLTLTAAVVSLVATFRTSTRPRRRRRR